jgi:hypothetical protein
MRTKEEENSGVSRDQGQGRFEISLRQELIRAIESGTPRSVIAYQYGMSRATLSKWMGKHSSPSYQAKQRGAHLTAVEKRSIVRQIEQGILTPYAARKTHGISGPTLQKWLSSPLKENAELAVYNPFEMKDRPAETPASPDEEKEALKKALAESQLKINALNTLIDVAEEQFKIAIRKKPGARQSK